MLSVAQDYSRVDATIELYPKTVASAEELTYFISRDFTTQDEKVRAIYTWLIQNLAYDPDEYKSFNYSFTTYSDGNKKEAKARANIINRTLQTGKAVCEGYAMTFEKLCQLQGITNYLVRGDTKTHFKDINRAFRNNHMWNIVQLEGYYYLFDPTWGAGKYTTKFIKEPTYYYFKTPPEEFIKTHYPDQIEDAFLKEEVSKEAFLNSPIYIDPTLKLLDVPTSRNGVVNSMQNDALLYFAFATSPASIQYAFDGVKNEVTNVETKTEGTFFSIPLELGVKTLLIYIDHAPVLGYIVK